MIFLLKKKCISHTFYYKDRILLALKTKYGIFGKILT